MIRPVCTEISEFLPVDTKEVARYAGVKIPDEKTYALIRSCADELYGKFSATFKICYAVLPLIVSEDIADFSVFSLKSKDLARCLKGAKNAIVLACTMGFQVDKAINRYAELDAPRALIFQALGAERVETYLDKFSADLSEENNFRLTPRFSPGYGDLPLSAQKPIFDLLSPQKYIGLTLNDSLLMSPSKSVTAIVGINGDKTFKNQGCKDCNAVNCEFARK